MPWDETRERGLYVHFPFCVHKCTYCDFYSLPGRLNSLEDYLLAVRLEAEHYSGLAFNTLYLGGGTPSLLGSQGIIKLLGFLRDIFDLSSLAEATIEANPESLTTALVDSALSSGFNRISIGVQSLSDAELLSVGRPHNTEQALDAFKKTLRAGFRNISADVIIGLPGQDWSSLRGTLEKLIALNLRHISAYCLTVEPHTPLASNPPPGLPDEDAQAELYAQTVQLLAQTGFHHYEISNFARPGFECRHNLNYWRGGEYLGLGPAAASHLNERRFKNSPDLDAYLFNPAGQVEEVEKLLPTAKAAEEAVIRLRLLEEGLDTAALSAKFGKENVLPLREKLTCLAAEGYLTQAADNFYLVPEYALVSNPILARLLP